MPDSEPVFPHEPDHIIAIKFGGQTTSRNLAYAFFDCNRAKGSAIASIDPAGHPLLSARRQRAVQQRVGQTAAGVAVENAGRRS